MASRLSRETNRCGPAWISTWAITVSRTTRLARPVNLLRDRLPEDSPGLTSWQRHDPDLERKPSGTTMLNCRKE
jgi:hypothetical protein